MSATGAVSIASVSAGVVEAAAFAPDGLLQAVMEKRSAQAIAALKQRIVFFMSVFPFMQKWAAFKSRIMVWL